MTDLPWYYRHTWSGVLKHPALRVRPVLWDATLTARSALQDIVHVHTGGLSPHMRWLRTPWVVHLHGTDVRTRQYDGWSEKLQFGVQHAAAVLYSTPDLLPHVLELRPRTEPIYFPGPVNLTAAPSWSPVPGRVIFASRWEADKGGSAQVQIAREIRARNPDAEVLGLRWGSDAEAARAAGVRLLPRMGADDYKKWLSSGAVVVGQMTGALGISELEALSIGVPLVSGALPAFYPDLRHLSDPTIDAVAEAALKVLGDPQTYSTFQQGRLFVAQKHDVVGRVNDLLKIYHDVLA